MSSSQPDILVVGGGMAGTSAAAELARTHRVMLLEGEDALGLHSTGRSAAVFSETYGNQAVRALTRASRDFFYDPPAGFSPYPLLKRRSWLHVASAIQAPALEDLLAKEDVALRVRRISPQEARALLPLLRPETVAAGGAYDSDAADIDVDGLHRGYLRLLRQHGGAVITNARVTTIVRRSGNWLLQSTAGAFQAPIVINAAGAWADRIGMLAGIPSVRIQACRRTAVLVELAGGGICAEWPLIIDIDEAYYFKPDAGLLLISPADETPVEPCDAQPEELDVATAIDRVEKATLMTIKRVRRSWAGLRSFAPDRSPVIGFDEAAPGFFWLAGQGGYGIQTAPAAARLAAALVRGETLPRSLLGLDPACVAPGRFTRN